MHYTWKIYKSRIKIINLKYQLPCGTKDLNYLADHILSQIFKIILSISSKASKRNLNEIKNRIIFKTKTGYYLELLSPETRKLHGSTKSKISEDGNGKSVPNLEIT